MMSKMMTVVALVGLVALAPLADARGLSTTPQPDNWIGTTSLNAVKIPLLDSLGLGQVLRIADVARLSVTQDQEQEPSP